MQIHGISTPPQIGAARPAASPASAPSSPSCGDSVRISGKSAGCGKCGSGACTCGTEVSSKKGCGCGAVCTCQAASSHRSTAGTACAVAGGPAAVAASVVSASAPKPVDLTAALKAMLPDHPFVISADKAKELQKALNLSTEQLLMALIPVAKEYARPPISNFHVGAAGLGKSGQIYLGVNLEFPGNALNQTVHGEQFTVTNALRNGEQGLDMLAVSAAPCGHCRQWLNEVTGGADLKILTPDNPPTPLKELLPASFGPGDLGVTGALLSPQEQHLQEHPGQLHSDPSLAAASLQAADASYAPYSHSPSGVAVRLKDGTMYTGKYSENAAFNPSLSPLQGAIIGMVAEGRSYDEIEHVVLTEKGGAPASQQAATRTLLESVNPEAGFELSLAD
jgi:cytidine deaminase